MPGQRPILAMSFIASLGITFEVLACTLPKGANNFWPLLVLIFYMLLPLPMIMSKQIISDTMIGLDRKTTVKARDYCIFFTSGIMVSIFAFPIVLSNTSVVSIVSHRTHFILIHRYINYALTTNLSSICKTVNQIHPIQCFLVEVGNILILATGALFCLYFKPMGGL